MSDYGSTPPPPPPTPYGAPGAPSAPPPPNYLVWAILTTILCCLPLGIVSIVFSTQVNSKWALGDVTGAQEASAKAKRFAIWSAIVWAILTVIIVGFWVVVVAVGGGEWTFNTGTDSGY
jgi:heme/copper-type cytochrome/quinol oxidase subunit 2